MGREKGKTPKLGEKIRRGKTIFRRFIPLSFHLFCNSYLVALNSILAELMIIDSVLGRQEALPSPPSDLSQIFPRFRYNITPIFDVKPRVLCKDVSSKF